MMAVKCEKGSLDLIAIDMSGVEKHVATFTDVASKEFMMAMFAALVAEVDDLEEQVEALLNNGLERIG